MHRFPGQLPALQRQHHPAAEHRIEKRQRIAHQQQPRRRAVARMTAVFARDEVVACGVPDGQAVLDPQILFHFPMEDLFRILHSVARQVFALGDNPHARHSVVLWDVPEPSFFRDVSHRRVALVDPFAAFGILVVRPDRDLVQIRVAHPPPALIRRESFLARAIEDDPRPHFVGLARGAIRGLDTDHLFALHQQPVHRRLFAHFGAFLPGIVQQHLVKLRAQHLPALRDRLTVVAREKVEGLRAPAIWLNECHAVLLHEVRSLHLRDHPDALQRPVGKRDQRLADVIARKFLPLHDEHAVPVFGQDGRGTGPRRPASNENDIIVLGREWGVIHGSRGRNWVT